MKQFAVRGRLHDNLRRALDPIALVQLERLGDRLLHRKCARQNGAILDRHRRALGEVRQCRVRRVTDERDTIRAPVRRGWAIMQRPAIAGVLVGGIDHRLHRRIPAAVIGFELLPREFQRPRFFGNFAGLDAADEIEQRAAAQVVADGVAAGADEHRHRFFQRAFRQTSGRHRDAPGRVACVGRNRRAEHLCANDRFQAIGRDQQIAAFR